MSGSFVRDSKETILTLPKQLSFSFEYHEGNNLPMFNTTPFIIEQCVWRFMPLQVKMCQTHQFKHRIKYYSSTKGTFTLEFEVERCGFQQV